jgi:5'-3' exonuclease
MVVLFDADSLIFASCFNRLQNIDDTPFITDLNEAIKKFNSGFEQIIDEVQEVYPELTDVIVFNGSRNKYRKEISKEYKANRKKQELPPLLSDLHNYVKQEYNSVFSDYYETDDMVATYWKNKSDELGTDNVLIVAIDKDYMQFPALIYNYHYTKKSFIKLSKQDAWYNFYTQMIVGDSADNVNYCKGYGKKYAEKLLSDKKTKFAMQRAVYTLYKDIYKEKAKENFVECYKLLKLVENI